MKLQKRDVVITVAYLLLVACPLIAEAGGVILPNYAAGQDVAAQAQTTGKNIMNLVLLLVGIAGTIGMGVGALKMTWGDKEGAKQYLFGGAGGIFVATVIYGIANLAAGH